MSLDYVSAAKKVEEGFLDTLLTADHEWKEVKKTDGTTIFSCKSPSIDKIYKSEAIIDASPEKVLALVSPLRPYRVQWDPFLEKLDIIKNIGNVSHFAELLQLYNAYVIQHFTRPAFKGAVSARDSVDVVTIGKRDTYFYVAAGGFEGCDSVHAVSKDYVRTFQYPCGYLIELLTDTPDKCRFTMVFHSDLQMSNLVSMIATMVKPTLMADKVKALKKAATTMDVTAEHLQTGIE